MNTPTPVGFEFLEKVQSLEALLIGQHPQMPVLLSEIHRTLKKQPENVTLLNEEQISIIFRALEKHTGNFLAESVTKSAKKPGSVAALKSKGIEAF